MNSSESDPVIDEVRAIRHQISERIEHDPSRLIAYYMNLQDQHRERLLRDPGTDDRRGRSAA